MRTPRKLAAIATAVAVVTGLSAIAASADDFPSRRITMVIPFPAGGGTDQIMRVIGQEVSKSNGQPFIILNRAGAGGTIAATMVKQADPDGYTLFFGNMGTHAINPHIRKVDYNPEKDFAPITHVMTFPHVLVVPAANPATSVAELVAFAKKKIGGANFGTQGIGSGGQVLGEMLRAQSGAPMTAINYPGAAPSIMDTVAGRVDFMFSSYAPVLPFVLDKRLRVLAVTGNKRLDALPDVPTLSEAGFPGVKLDYWFAVFAPAGTPKAVVDKLNAEFKKAGMAASVRKIADTSGATLAMSSPEALAKLVDTDNATMGEFLKKANVKLK